MIYVKTESNEQSFSSNLFNNFRILILILLSCFIKYFPFLFTLFKKGFLNNVSKNGKYFINQLDKIKDKYPKIIKEVRGKGLLIGLCLHVNQAKFIQKLLDNNLLTVRAAENVVRLLPPLNVTKSEINLGLKIIEKVCKKF